MKKDSSSSKYLKCYDCDWSSEVGATDKTCPKCDGFLCKKSSTLKSKPTPRSKPKTHRRAASSHDGFRLKKLPGTRGWKFIEGHKINSKQLFTKADEKALNACARRRGLIKTSRHHVAG